MGMTDMQFKAFIRAELSDLEEALKLNPDNEKLKEMIVRHKETLQS